MKVLYLDFDGVLHPDNMHFDPRKRIVLKAAGHTLFEWTPILEKLLIRHPEVQIVLATSWVPNRSFAYAKRWLPWLLQERVIGATFHRGHHDTLSFLQKPRGQQIVEDVFRRAPSSWFAIDDDGLHWPAWCRDNLIQTDGEVGISDPRIENAIRTMLERM